MNLRPNILVICGRNKRRSRTAEFLFKNDSRMNIRSAGLSSKSDRKLQQSDVDWSDLIFVMDDEQRKRVRSLYRGNDIPKILVLHIDDIYEYRDPELVELLLDRINEGIESEIKL